MFASGCSPNIHSFTCLIKGISLRGRWHEALYVWDGIKEGILPNVVAYNALLHGLCLAGNMNMALSVCNAMERSDCHPNSTTYSTLIYGFAKSGDVIKASEIWNRMITLGCHPNVVVYTCMVDVLCRNFMFEQAYSLLDNMVIEDFPPNTITFNKFIKGLCFSGRVEWAMVLYNQMETFGCSGNTATYNELLDGLFKCNNVTVALELVREMEENDIEIIVTKILITSYYDIVRRNTHDLVPKSIMHYLVNHAKRHLLDTFIENLYREPFEDLLQLTYIKGIVQKIDSGLRIITWILKAKNKVRSQQQYLAEFSTSNTNANQKNGYEAKGMIGELAMPLTQRTKEIRKQAFTKKRKTVNRRPI
ncbi:pentatricopeptide repeat-containing protein At3g48810-like [Nicotiana sylvestris]|uniref:pentatricopeptide repeat-containing protein At3g48810-like n=1 Tax=Nicotiana sylvestris TaxID=4096 RepID=UPI00388CB862